MALPQNPATKEPALAAMLPILLAAAACSISALLVSCSSPEAARASSDPLARENIDSNQTLSQKKILEILRAEKRLKSNFSDNFRSPESISEIRRINSMWEEYLLNNKKDFHALVLYGKFCRFSGDFPRSYSAFQKANEINPNVALVKQQLALYEAENGFFDIAREHINEAISLSPETPSYYEQRAALISIYRRNLVETGRFPQKVLDDEMLSSYAKAAELQPGNLDAQRNYALSFFDVGKADWNKALKQWELVLKLSPLEAEKRAAKVNIARVMIELNRDSEAEEILKSVNDDSLLQIKLALLDIIARAKSGEKQK